MDHRIDTGRLGSPRVNPIVRDRDWSIPVNRFLMNIERCLLNSRPFSIAFGGIACDRRSPSCSIFFVFLFGVFFVARFETTSKIKVM